MSTLTKREEFAKAAMRELLGHHYMLQGSASVLALQAVQYGDAMLAELAKTAPASEPVPEPARTPGPNDVPGCEFVHATGRSQGYYIPRTGDAGFLQNSVRCQCGVFNVRDTWHWHSAGICHNPTRCHGAEDGK